MAVLQRRRDFAGHAPERSRGRVFSRHHETPAGKVVVASAMPIATADRTEVARLARLRQTWQAEAWTYRRALGELRYATNYLGNSCMRLRLYVGTFLPGENSPAEVSASSPQGLPPDLVETAIRVLEELHAGSPVGSSPLIKTLTESFQVAGEGYLVGRPDPADPSGDVRTWKIRSTSEIAVDRQGRIGVRETPGQATNDIDWLDLTKDYVSRLWTPDPEWGMLADSPFRGILDVAEELLLAGRDVRSTLRSRIANNGILLVPDDLSVVGREPEGDDDEDDPFLAELVEAGEAALSDEGNAAGAFPVVVRGPGEALKTIRHLLLDRPQNKFNIAQRLELITRIATGIDLPSEVLTGKIDLNHWPCDESTEVLTRDRGWVTHDELDVGTEVLALDHVAGVSRWVALDGVRREHVVDHTMLRIEKSTVDALTTPDHKWPVLRGSARCWTDTRGLQPNDHIVRAAPHADVPTAPKYDDALVALVAWFVTDGSTTWPNDHSPQLYLSQSHRVNPAHTAVVRSHLTTLYGLATADMRRGPGVPRGADVPPRWRETSDDVSGMTRFYLNKSAAAPIRDVMADLRRKIVDPSFVTSLTHAQLLLFLDSWVSGDGSVSPTGSMHTSQRDADRIEAFALAAILAGRPVLYQSRYVPDGVSFNAGPMTNVRVPTREYTVPMRTLPSEVSYTGVIFCPRVPVAHSFLARRNGTVYYTGNSAWQVDDDTFRHHIEPTAIQQVDALTIGYVWRRLDSMGVWPTELVRRLVVWYDPTDLVTHPDRTSDAMNLWDRFALSDEALRRITGFRAEDKPSDDEILLRVAMRMRSVDPSIQAQILHVLNPAIDISIPTGKPDGTRDTPIKNSPPEPDAGPPAVEQSAHVRVASAIVVRPNPLHARALRARVECALAAIQAPAAPDTRLSRALLDVDRRLRDRVHTAANTAVRRALERAGARVVSRARSSKMTGIREAISDVPAALVPGTLGIHVLASLGFNQANLIDVEFSEMRQQWDQWVADAQTAALREVAVAAGVVLGDLLAEYRSRADESRAEGWRWLQRALTAAATAYLAKVDDLDGVELATADLVVLGQVRAALAIAGGYGASGQSVGVNDDGRPVDPAEVMGQVGTGYTVAQALAANGFAYSGYEWVWGGTASPFVPHQRLDGVQFSSWDDDVTRAADPSFPDGGHYYPGDHAGCSCDALPVIVRV